MICITDHTREELRCQEQVPYSTSKNATEGSEVVRTVRTILRAMSNSIGQVPIIRILLRFRSLVVGAEKAQELDAPGCVLFCELQYSILKDLNRQVKTFCNHIADGS